MKKNVLEKLTDRELEKYIEEGNRFVPEANRYAFEILKSRGRIFQPDELKRFDKMMEKKTVQTETVIHPNHTKSAKLIYASGAVGIINIFFTPEIFEIGAGLFTGLATLAIIFLLGYLISKGNDQIKYFLLVLILL